MTRGFELIRILAALCLAATPLAAQAERVRVELGAQLPRADKLKAGTRTYVRYFQNADGSMEVIDIQTKEIRFEGSGAARTTRVLQRWDGPASSRRLDTVVEAGTLRPLTHQRDITKDAKTVREGFRFLRDRVVGLEGQPDNSRKDFAISTPTPTFNFEIDMETLQALPLRAGAEFEIVFYHPGGPPPALYTFKVAGDERITFAGEPVDCWVVTTDYNRSDAAPSRFWIAKESQTVVRVHNPTPDGRAVVKALLPITPR